MARPSSARVTQLVTEVLLSYPGFQVTRIALEYRHKPDSAVYLTQAAIEVADSEPIVQLRLSQSLIEVLGPYNAVFAGYTDGAANCSFYTY